MARQQLPPQIKIVHVTDRRTQKQSRRYVVTVDTTVPGEKRRQVQRRFKTEREARDFLTDVQGAVADGGYAHPTKRTVAEAIDDWLDVRSMDLKPSTISGYRVTLAPLKRVHGDKPVQKLTEADLARLVRDLKDGTVDGHGKWKSTTRKHLIAYTQAILKSEKRQGVVRRNVAEDLRMPSIDDASPAKTLTEEQMTRVLADKSRESHLWTLALYGMRRGEIAGLRWDSVDLPNKVLHIAENRVSYGREISVGTPKSVQSRRTLPLPDEVVSTLKAARRRQRTERLALGDAYAGGDYVASDEGGEPMHPSVISKRWGSMLDRLDIEHVRLHDARHTCGTLMHLRGVPIAVISAWLGHSSAAFTMSRYAHSQDDALRAAGEALRASSD